MSVAVRVQVLSSMSPLRCRLLVNPITQDILTRGFRKNLGQAQLFVHVEKSISGMFGSTQRNEHELVINCLVHAPEVISGGLSSVHGETVSLVHYVITRR